MQCKARRCRRPCLRTNFNRSYVCKLERVIRFSNSPVCRLGDITNHFVKKRYSIRSTGVEVNRSIGFRPPSDKLSVDYKHLLCAFDVNAFIFIDIEAAIKEKKILQYDRKEVVCGMSFWCRVVRDKIERLIRLINNNNVMWKLKFR